MKKIFVYVGHSNWGKSLALKSITSGSAKKRTATIGEKPFFVRKMSNDDDGEKLLEFAKGIKAMNYQTIIIAFCPNQEHNDNAMEILEILKDAGYLYFFVQEKQFKGDGVIPSAEIESLKKFGDVKVLETKEESEIRAREFTNYIEANLT